MSLLSVRQVVKRYERSGRSRTALDGVSLELERGQMIGIYGPSGAGKTTLLRIAAGLMAPDSGEVIYDGQPLAEMGAGERKRLRRREIACVWSDGQSQERLSVADHVALPLLVDGREHRRAERAAREALGACELEGCAELELGELSGGERQRVEIARAIATEPRLLLADGPASGLSLIEQEQVMALLRRLARDARTAVLIADGEAAALIGADPLLYLNDGRIVGEQDVDGGGEVIELPRRRAADA